MLLAELSTGVDAPSSMLASVQAASVLGHPARPIQMKIQIKRSVVVADFPGVHPGDIIDCPDEVAGNLIVEGIAEPWQESTLTPPQTIEQRDPEVEHRDPGLTAEPLRPVKRAKKTQP